jgi:predicted transcriptional regulator
MDRLTREGLADVDAGRTIPHEVVVRWVNEVLLAWGGLA